MLDFLRKNKDEILKLSEEKTKVLAGVLASSEQLRAGLPHFYEDLVEVLKQKLLGKPTQSMLKAAADHGRESLRLGYSLSHVVHAYGAMCQAITELASRKSVTISANEFNILNGCLDIAIAAAVSEFQFRSNEATEDREVQSLGFLAHELRSALSSATIAHEMIKSGVVGTSGSTSSVLEANLIRMRNLIDRSLSEVRMRADADLFIEKFRLSDLFDQAIVTAQFDAQKRKQILAAEVDWHIEVSSDRQFILSAVANLTQNAVKYTKSEGKIWLRAKESGDRVLIEVEDECGGIETEKLSSLFDPFVQESSDRSGLGLGLTIARRALDLVSGKISITNRPGIGCSFLIDIPKVLLPEPSKKAAVPGVDSVQPKFSK